VVLVLIILHAAQLQIQIQIHHLQIHVQMEVNRTLEIVKVRIHHQIHHLQIHVQMVQVQTRMVVVQVIPRPVIHHLQIHVQMAPSQIAMGIVQIKISNHSSNKLVQMEANRIQTVTVPRHHQIQTINRPNWENGTHWLTLRLTNTEDDDLYNLDIKMHSIDQLHISFRSRTITFIFSSRMKKNT
jgi:hypothetical protein